MDFLFEIGLEEVPARMIAAAEAELVRRVGDLLARERLLPNMPTITVISVQSTGRLWHHSQDLQNTIRGALLYPSYSTPRRLAVLMREVRERQEDVAEELLGPAVKIAYKDGVPGPAAEAFARKAGVDVSALKTVTTPKGDYVAATAVRAGRSAAEVIAAELPKEIAAIYWPKNMYWRAGKPERFVRPVRWLLCLLGNDVVPVSFGGYTAGRETFGHRVLAGPQAIQIDAPEQYVAALRAAFVEPNVEARRRTIRKALDRVCRTIPGARWREDHALVDKMTHMTEWPSVIAGDFDAGYLELPEEVLVTVMRDHQNYFAVEDQAGKLAPHFLAVLNTEATPAGEAVIRHGNARVLRARFNDARFFWEFDQRTPLAARVALLENVTFQKDLGSYAEKSHRVRLLCEALYKVVEARGVAVDFGALTTAATLAKTDLTAELVKEFTELQGIIGGLYARSQGLGEAAAAAIYDQYRPASMEDGIPRTIEGQLLAIADKADTITGMFGLGLEPTGSKDPFALRRAANGVVKILAESALPLTLGDIVGAATANRAVKDKVASFFVERLAFYLREVKGQAYDVVKAVLKLGEDDVRDAVARAEALSSTLGSADFRAVSAAFKRMRGILDQVAGENWLAGPRINPSIFKLQAEFELFEAAGRLMPTVQARRLAKDYASALAATATMRPQIDSFLDTVMVMDADPELRANRLALLAMVLVVFGGIADYAEIVVAG